MKPLAIIPARAGSKRLPEKNRQEISPGLNLIQAAIQQAADSGLFSADQRLMIGRICVTSDDPLVQVMDSAVPTFRIGRPVELAGDGTEMVDVVRHAVDFMRLLELDFDTIVLLQPTSPLRSARDIIEALAMMQANNCEAVVSVVETRQPDVYTLGHASRLRPVADHLDGRRMVVPNGAVYAITTDAWDRGLDWWTVPAVYAYEMPAERSVDIDTIVDLERARQLWPHQQL